MKLFQNFNGSGPEIAPLLRRRGFDQAPTEVNPATGADDAASIDTPHYGTWGFDLAGRDLAVKPGTDFYNFANGRGKVPKSFRRTASPRACSINWRS